MESLVAKVDAVDETGCGHLETVAAGRTDSRRQPHPVLRRFASPNFEDLLVESDDESVVVIAELVEVLG